MQEPITLGDKLAPIASVNLTSKFRTHVRRALRSFMRYGILLGMFYLIYWWQFMHPEADKSILISLLVVLGALWLALHERGSRAKFHKNRTHPLLANDRQGFMRDLRLDAKTVIVDGSNVYHFGRSNGLDAQPLGEIVHKLRSRGYRIVCFFDANIFYTLSEHGAFPGNQRHSLVLLKDIFGLRDDEIYVVPSGFQADKYILDCLKHLPISFAVTNDRFRDYAAEYQDVMKDNQWRKGIVISKSGVNLQ